MEYNKIYARADSTGKVIHIFSEVFEKPLATDVLIDGTNVDRHGAQKYPVVDENGFYNYEIKNGVLVNRDKTADKLIAENKLKIEELKIQLAATDYKAIKYAEGFISEEEYAPIKAERQAMRDKINELEAWLKTNESTIEQAITVIDENK